VGNAASSHQLAVFFKGTKEKTGVALNFGLHWDPKEGYKSMEIPGSCFAGFIFKSYTILRINLGVVRSLAVHKG
jgi:hypothetical protein